MVQRLGYFAFTEAARVRLPVGELTFSSLIFRLFSFSDVYFSHVSF